MLDGEAEAEVQAAVDNEAVAAVAADATVKVGIVAALPFVTCGTDMVVSPSSWHSSELEMSHQNRGRRTLRAVTIRQHAVHHSAFVSPGAETRCSCLAAEGDSQIVGSKLPLMLETGHCIQASSSCIVVASV